MDKLNKRDCRYCVYCMCNSPVDENADCYADNFKYFSHHIEDFNEAEDCEWFVKCSIFPKL